MLQSGTELTVTNSPLMPAYITFNSFAQSFHEIHLPGNATLENGQSC